jgi:multidrug resistance efflux pump
VSKRFLSLVCLLLALCSLVGCARASASVPSPTPVPQEEPQAAAGLRQRAGTVTASGIVAPETWSSLSASGSGSVAQIMVKPGQYVAAGTPLLRLDTTDLEISLHVAEQGAALQQALLDQLLTGASDRQVARAERDNAHRIAQARLALQASRQQLAQAQARDPAQDVAAAQDRVRQLELQIARNKALDPAPSVVTAQIELERAKIALAEVQDEYNKALDRPWEEQEIRDAWAKQLEQAQLNDQLAQAQLENALNARRAHAIGLQVLEAQLQEARTVRSQAIDAQQAYSITLSILNTEVQVAQAELAYLQGWDNPLLDEPTTHQIAQAEARLEQARWAVAQIEQQIQDAEVRAPFAGTVGTVHVQVGAFVSPGQPLLVLGDLSSLRVETTDLSERDVDRVQIGQTATVFVEALSVNVTGQVVSIAPEATTVGGDVVYQVIVALDEQPPGLRWGMSVEVEIEAD